MKIEKKQILSNETFNFKNTQQLHTVSISKYSRCEIKNEV